MATFRATYRLQLGPGLDFAAAEALVPYLAELGVSHVYLSPSFAARAGSTHGYDVVDPGRFSDVLGGEAGFRSLAAAARAAGLGIVLDIVPNHMATDAANPYWADPARRATFFDLDPETGRHRRFFDIDHLAGVRQEDPEVFAATHRLALELVREGLVDGLRIDHPDGLADPAGYLDRLRGGAAHVWVEKILDPGEQLRDWPVEGTVGYEFLNDVAALFVDPAGEGPITAQWERLAGDPRPFGAWAAEAKAEQARTTFAPDVDWLRRLRPGVEGLEEALAALPVYRTYIRDGVVGEADREVLDEAGLGGWLDGASAEFVTRFQQTTPPIMAKGVEDTAFYRYVRLLALNDVGGDPSRWSVSVDAFHTGNAERAARFPHRLLCTQTHDTKRSGDVRARIGALASLAEEWVAEVERWRELCAPLREDGAPDPVEELTVFQTLVGAWPIDAERLCAYMEKALREAKRHTTWVDVDAAWEERVMAYCRAVLELVPFRAAFDPFAERVAALGELHALRQTALKLTAPGVPDIYQGDECQALSLVDPDNRRPVDWERRRALLGQLREGAAPMTPDARKLFLVRELLALRARRPDAFAGSYAPLDAGPDAVAFARGDEVVVAMPVREGGLDTDALPLPRGSWRPAFEADLLPGAQIAVLERR